MTGAETLINRIGRFDIAMAIIDKRPDLARRVLGECVVLRAECMLSQAAIEYVARCSAFAVVEDGDRVPDYDIEIDEDAGTITWVRKPF